MELPRLDPSKKGSYRSADALLEAYSKRNPIVVLHNVYMDQNQSCLAA